MKKMALGMLLASMLVACGEEPEIDPEKRCAEEGHKTFASGSLGSNSFELPLDAVEGLVANKYLTLKLPGYKGKTLLLKMYFSDGASLLDDITRATSQTFEIVDATNVPSGSMNISGLNNYMCPLGEGKVCAQVGVDVDGDGAVTDEDREVYNAKSGSVTFSKIDGLSKSIVLTWTLDLGADIFNADMSSPGTMRGCLDAKYTSIGSGTWSIE